MNKKEVFLLYSKPSILFIAGLYLLGFCWFPSMGIGYVIFDFLLPSEIIGVTFIGSILIIWSLYNIYIFVTHYITNR